MRERPAPACRTLMRSQPANPNWSGWVDSNHRPPGSEPGRLPLTYTLMGFPRSQQERDTGRKMDHLAGFAPAPPRWQRGVLSTDTTGGGRWGRNRTDGLPGFNRALYLLSYPSDGCGSRSCTCDLPCIRRTLRSLSYPAMAHAQGVEPCLPGLEPGTPHGVTCELLCMNMSKSWKEGAGIEPDAREGAHRVAGGPWCHTRITLRDLPLRLPSRERE